MQTRAGVRESARRVGGIVGETISEAFAAFLASVPLVAVGAEDEHGRLWATLLAGRPGFVRAHGPADARDRLEVAASPVAGDALALRLGAIACVGAPAGVTAIDPATRRRVRVNGRLAPRENAASASFTLEVAEAYGNCPRYITARELGLADESPAASFAATAALRPQVALLAAHVAWLQSADMLFVASIGPQGRADASHRGGAPGFVVVPDATHVVIPDYSGNRMFNTLGNLLVDPRIGLVIPDFARGALLQISGRACVVDKDARVTEFPGAERLLEVAVEAVNQVEASLPAGGLVLGYSPFDPPPYPSH